MRSIIQDRKGFIWIGTRGGLNRFDGYTFKAYKNSKHKFGYLGNDIILVIAEDQKEMLWVGTGKGIFKYNPLSEDFTRLAESKGYISHLLVDNENNLWFLSNYSLYSYNQKTKKIQDHHMSASCLAIDDEQNLWIGNDDGLVTIFHSKNKSRTEFRVVGKDIPADLRSVSSILPTGGDEVLVGLFKQGLKSLNVKTGETKAIPLGDQKKGEIFVRNMIKGENHDYWIATESGIYIYNILTHKSTVLQKRAGDPYAISDNAVYTLCKDNEGGIWAGTYFGGVNYFSKENARFKKYYPIPNLNTISGTAVREITSDHKGNLWIGTEDAGINKFDLNTQKFTNYTTTGSKKNLSYPNIHGLLAVGNQLFIGPFLHGMEIMDTRTGLISDRFRYIVDEKGKVSDLVLSIYLTKDSTILVGAAFYGSGLFAYDQKKKKFRRITNHPDHSYVLTIKEDSKGNIWTGSSNEGAFYYNPKSGKTGNIRFGDKNIEEFPVYGISEDKQGNMWFATDGGGLIKVNSKGKILKRFTTENGLPTNTLFRILEDESDNLWISSLKGLICLNSRTEQVKIYTQSNGLISDQFNYNSSYKDQKGTMYFGSVAGLIAFNPTELNQRQASPPTYITGFEINNAEITPDESNGPLKKSIIFTDTITLRHDENNFSIKFSALSYSSSDVIRYKFKMEGLSDNWTFLNSNRNAYFTDLSPGRYTFLVRAQSNIGNWVGQERQLYIEVLPPIWMSPAAYFLYIIAFVIILYLGIRHYHKSQELKNANKLKLFEHEKVKEVYQAKIEFFTNIAHEIQTPLTLISVPTERVMEEIDDYPRIRRSLLMIEKNTKRLVDLINQLLDFRQTEIEQFGLNFVNVDINEVIKDQIEAFNELANESNIDLQARLPDEHLIAFVDREALVKICSNLISNAVKYAVSEARVELVAPEIGEKQFIVRFYNDGAAIQEEFRDKIFEPFFRLRRNEKPGTGIGLPLAQSLTELHGGKLILSSAELNNIVFELTLPVHQEFEFQLSS